MAPDDRTDDAPQTPPADAPATPAPDGDAASGEPPEEAGRLKGLKRWARTNAPGFHVFLTNEQKPYPLMRELAVGAVVLLLAATLLWGGTGQSLGDSPVVVIESGSMMHCDQGRSTLSSACEGSYGRLGTIDPGDLVFVRDVDARADVTTFAAEARCDDTELGQLSCACDHETFGACGDVIIYKPGGSDLATPIIHRALFWLEVHDDGTFSVPECGLDRVERSELNDVCLASLGARGWNNAHYLDALTAEDSGFVTRGDNNAELDVPGITPYPVRPDWILGKARGEVPWVGLVKLWVSDFTTGCSGDPRIPCNFDNAPPDVKTLMWLTVGVLVVSPFVVEKVQTLRQRDEDEETS